MPPTPSPSEKPIDALGDEPSEYEVACAQLRHAITLHPPIGGIEVAGNCVVTGEKYMATGKAGIWFVDGFGNMYGSTNLATLMKVGAQC